MTHGDDQFTGEMAPHLSEVNSIGVDSTTVEDAITSAAIHIYDERLSLQDRAQLAEGLHSVFSGLVKIDSVIRKLQTNEEDLATGVEDIFAVNATSLPKNTSGEVSHISEHDEHNEGGMTEPLTDSSTALRQNDGSSSDSDSLGESIEQPFVETDLVAQELVREEPVVLDQPNNKAKVPHELLMNGRIFQIYQHNTLELLKLLRSVPNVPMPVGALLESSVEFTGFRPELPSYHSREVMLRRTIKGLNGNPNLHFTGVTQEWGKDGMYVIYRPVKPDHDAEYMETNLVSSAVDDEFDGQQDGIANGAFTAEVSDSSEELGNDNDIEPDSVTASDLANDSTEETDNTDDTTEEDELDEADNANDEPSAEEMNYDSLLARDGVNFTNWGLRYVNDGRPALYVQYTEVNTFVSETAAHLTALLGAYMLDERAGQVIPLTELLDTVMELGKGTTAFKKDRETVEKELKGVLHKLDHEVDDRFGPLVRDNIEIKSVEHDGKKTLSIRLKRTNELDPYHDRAPLLRKLGYPEYVVNKVAPRH